MSNDFFTQIKTRREDAIAALDASTFAPAIRNHLIQLFRKAHAKDSGLTGVLVGMGCALGTGTYTGTLDGETRKDDARDWGNQVVTSPEVHAFLKAVNEYSGLLCPDLPYIDDITVADLTTTRAKKAAIHGPKGSRYRL